MKTLLSISLLLLSCFTIYSQPLLYRYENRSLVSVDKIVYNADNLFHTSVRPFIVNELDSTAGYTEKMIEYHITTDSKLKEILLNRNFIIIKGDDFKITADPLFDFGYGYDFEQKRSQWINTRGFIVDGTLGKNFAFSTTFRETQARLPAWVIDYVFRRHTIPGQGWLKSYAGRTALDFANASGYISWSPGKFFNLRAGHGKNFLGDGYRSLLLSDCSYYYPYFMVTTTFWKIKYVNIWSQFSHPDIIAYRGKGDAIFAKKYSAMHYLSFIPWNKLNFSLFESVTWNAGDSTFHRGFELSYLNPIIFFRPVEFNLGSGDNEILGANIRFTPLNNLVLYGQFVIDEFRIKEMLSSDGWSGNKYAWQAGIKSFNIAGVDNLDLQAEFNLIRPYMYSHYTPVQNWSNAREPLAHPAGANTKEAVAIAKYNYKRLFINAKYIWAATGLDTSDINFGKNIFSTYKLNQGEYGNYTTQGRYTTLNQLDLSVNLLINPATNMNIFISATLRHEHNDVMDNRYSYLSFGIRTSLRNIYYDFY